MDGQLHEWTNQLMDRLGVHGLRPISANLDETGLVAGARRADFRAKWLFTKLHTFIFIHEVDFATAEHVRRFSHEATAYAIRSKGGLPRGFQTGVAVLPVLVCRSAAPEAVDFAGRRPTKRFAAFTLPMLVEVSGQRFITYHEPVRWGAYYQDFLGEQQRLVAGDFHGEILPPGGERRASRWMLASLAVGTVVAFLVPLVARLV